MMNKVQKKLKRITGLNWEKVIEGADSYYQVKVGYVELSYEYFGIGKHNIYISDTVEDSVSDEIACRGKSLKRAWKIVLNELDELLAHYGNCCDDIEKIFTAMNINDTEMKIVMDWFAPMEFFGARITNLNELDELLAHYDNCCDDI